MRKIVLAFLLMIFASCSEEDELPSKDEALTAQVWELIGSYTVKEGDAAVDIPSNWTETYIFNVDGSFEKVRIENGERYVAKGSFEAAEYDNDANDYLALTYSEGAGLRWSCTEGNTEILKYAGPGLLDNHSWQNCDGSVLEYRLSRP